MGRRNKRRATGDTGDSVLQDSEDVDSVATVSLKDFFKSELEKGVANIKSWCDRRVVAIEESVNFALDSIKTVASNQSVLQKECESLRNELVETRRIIAYMERDLDAVCQTQRRDFLVFSGPAVTESTQREVEDSVNVVYCLVQSLLEHRMDLSQVRGAQYLSPSKILVEFTTSSPGSERYILFRRKLSLQGTGLFINEYLIPRRQEIFTYLLQKKRERLIKSVFTRSGDVYMVIDGSSRPVRVNTPEAVERALQGQREREERFAAPREQQSRPGQDGLHAAGESRRSRGEERGRIPMPGAGHVPADLTQRHGGTERRLPANQRTSSPTARRSDRGEEMQTERPPPAHPNSWWSSFSASPINMDTTGPGRVAEPAGRNRRVPGGTRSQRPSTDYPVSSAQPDTADRSEVGPSAQEDARDAVTRCPGPQWARRGDEASASAANGAGRPQLRWAESCGAATPRRHRLPSPAPAGGGETGEQRGRTQVWEGEGAPYHSIQTGRQPQHGPVSTQGTERQLTANIPQRGRSRSRESADPAPPAEGGPGASRPAMEPAERRRVSQAGWHGTDIRPASVTPGR